MDRAQSYQDYQTALKRGQRYMQSHMARGENPSMPVLDEILSGVSTAGTVLVGTVEIPIDRVVGTVARGRTNAFAGNFMPLLPPDTEFAGKWVTLHKAHMEEGISDPILCTEYKGLFYVQEGHKRVSVLRFFEAATVLATVRRTIPAWDDTPEVQAYYEFMHFYKLSGTYRVFFDEPGCYEKLQNAIGFAPDHEWSEEERLTFSSVYWRFKRQWRRLQRPETENISPEKAFLTYLELYPYGEMLSLQDQEILEQLKSLLPQLNFVAKEQPTAVSTEPADGASSKGALVRLLDGLTRPVLNIAFVHATSPSASAWTGGHDAGRAYMEKQLGSRVRVKTYRADAETADAVMEQAAAEGAQLLIATASVLLPSARRAAALYKNMKVLVCALTVPYADVRTYYCRMYEAKFITGAIAGSLWTGGSIGYIARYPILGEPASINAFALGVRMTAPHAQIYLAWSSLSGSPWEALMKERVRIVSWHEGTVQDMKKGGLPMSTAIMQPDGSFEPMAVACWDWGKMYEQLVGMVLSGAFDSTVPNKSSAVNYWWGMNSGVIDIRLSEKLPAGVRQLANILREDLREGVLLPFHTRITDQQGRVRNDGSRMFTPEEIMRMNWLCDNVSGRIPRVEELLPYSQETTRLLALPEED